MTPEELEKYVTVMRDAGVSVFKTGDLHIELGPAPARPLARPDPDAPKPAPRQSTYDMFLFAATEGLPEEAE